MVGATTGLRRIPPFRRRLVVGTPWQLLNLDGGMRVEVAQTPLWGDWPTFQASNVSYRQLWLQKERNPRHQGANPAGFGHLHRKLTHLDV